MRSQTKLLYDVILEELRGIDEVEIVSAGNYTASEILPEYLRPGFSHIRHLGEIVIKPNMVETPVGLVVRKHKEGDAFPAILGEYTEPLPAIHAFRLRDRLAQNASIGEGILSTVYENEGYPILYRKVVGSIEKGHIFDDVLVTDNPYYSRMVSHNPEPKPE